MRINYRLLPIKAHFFFFMAALGPILPQLPVFAKQLGISPEVMGYVTSLLPILYVLAKPVVGYLIDSFPNYRKTIFISILATMVLCYAGFLFVPQSAAHKVPLRDIYHINVSQSIQHCEMISSSDQCTDYRAANCFVINQDFRVNFTGFLSKNDSTDQFTLCHSSPTQTANSSNGNDSTSIQCTAEIGMSNECLYGTSTFWLFILCMSIGTISFNVSNSVSDVICFDVLAEKTMHYGAQRVWGTIGFGMTALLSGIIVHFWQNDIGNGIGTIAPAVFIMLTFGLFDVISIKWLNLPQFSNDGVTIMSTMIDLLTQKSIAIFLVFATLAGVLDCFVVYYMFWHLEEVAERTGYMDSIKLIEGCVVAAECLGGEILFFTISGKILKRIGYVHCLSFCFFMYSVRMALVSMIPNPWWLVPIEFFMQGCTYALCYTCIVAYASAVAPPGTTSTVQGLVAGMDDGVGYALGSIIGGQVYKYLGGVNSFRVFSIAAFVMCIAHILLRPTDMVQNGGREEKEMKILQLKGSNGGDGYEAEPLQRNVNGSAVK